MFPFRGKKKVIMQYYQQRGRVNPLGNGFLVTQGKESEWVGSDQGLCLCEVADGGTPIISLRCSVPLLNALLRGVFRSQ